MRVRFEITLNCNGQFAWIATCLTLLQLGIGYWLASPDNIPFFPFLSVMLMLSFPASLLPMMVFSDFLNSQTPSMVEFCLLWFCMFLTGYVQWFLLLPRLRKARFTTLDLSKPFPTESPDSRPEKRRQCRKASPRAGIQVPSFNTQGLTPLQRAIKSK